MSNFKDIQLEILEEFEPFEDWMDRYSLLIEMGNELIPLSDNEKNEQNLISGCQSRVWIKANLNTDGTINFKADSDALIVKGIVALLLKVFNNQTPESILTEEIFFIDKLGLKEHLSPTRSNGLLSMLDRIKSYAHSFSK